MDKRLKALVLLVLFNLRVWAEEIPVMQVMQPMSDDDMEIVSDHDPATSESKKAQKDHDHHHGVQKDNLGTKPQASIIYSMPQSRVLPLR